MLPPKTPEQFKEAMDEVSSRLTINPGDPEFMKAESFLQKLQPKIECKDAKKKYISNEAEIVATSNKLEEIRQRQRKGTFISNLFNTKKKEEDKALANNLSKTLQNLNENQISTKQRIEQDCDQKSRENLYRIEEEQILRDEQIVEGQLIPFPQEMIKGLASLAERPPIMSLPEEEEKEEEITGLP